LCILLIIIWKGRNKFKSLLNRTSEWVIILIVTLLFIIFSLVNLRYLPVIDFLPYKTGVKIAEKMVIPEGVPADVYNTTFVYEKNGIKKEFSLANYPANDSTWKFVNQKSVLVRKGYKPPIHDFLISTLNGEDITQKILSDTGYSVLMISKKISEAKQKSLSEGFKLGNYCISKGINFYILTSSGTDEVKRYENGLTFCSADETTLKTMLRSNPGYILIKDGTILGKWSWANVPDKEWFGKEIKH
jgi:triosephosphate isomerase